MQHIARRLTIKIKEGKVLTIEKPVLFIPSFVKLGFETEELGPADPCVLVDVYDLMGQRFHKVLGSPVDAAYGSDANAYIQNPDSWRTSIEP